VDSVESDERAGSTRAFSKAVVCLEAWKVPFEDHSEPCGPHGYDDTVQRYSAMPRCAGLNPSLSPIFAVRLSRWSTSPPLPLTPLHWRLARGITRILAPSLRHQRAGKAQGCAHKPHANTNHPLGCSQCLRTHALASHAPSCSPSELTSVETHPPHLDLSGLLRQPKYLGFRPPC
jgi:hypothetical protein